MIQRNVLVDIALTPQELAIAFAEMGGGEQAEFFNELASLSTHWEVPFCFQAQAIIDSGALMPEGTAIMRCLGEYGEAA